MNLLAPRSVLVASVVAVAFEFGAIAVAKPPAGYAPLDQYTPASLAPNEPRLDIPFPGGATARTISRGTARVAVLVDANNAPVDFLVTQASDPSFGQALLDELKLRKFRAAQLKGVAIPDRTEIAYVFDSPLTNMQVMDAAANNTRLGADAKAVAAEPESKLDSDLSLTAASLPLLPPEAASLGAAGKPVKVFVTFFVDEQGHVRIPQVESSPSPALVADAIRVVQKWAFKPPTIKGKPAIVYAGRPVRFLTEAEARKAMAH